MKSKLLTILFLLSYQLEINAQTVNVGEVYISENTQFSTVDDLDNKTNSILINDGEFFIYKDLNNDGLIDFNESGLTQFVGDEQQIISSTNIIYLFDVLFDNNTNLQAAFKLIGELSITNQCNFEKGIIENLGGAFMFEKLADHINATDNSYVDGAVIKTGSNTFNFPVGDRGFYRYATISSPMNSEDTFSGEYFFEPPNDLYPLERRENNIEIINDKEYWVITKDSSDSNIMLTLNWGNESTVPEEIVADPQSDIHIVRWDNEQQLWIDEGGVVDIFSKTVTTPLLLEKYGVFTLGRVKHIQPPLEIIIYNGVSPNGDGDNDYFYIKNIQTVANNKVDVYNRWGVKVFSSTNYDTSGNVFKGYSDARLTLGGGLLPSGTYFYIVEYDYTNVQNTTERIKHSGYLFLNTD